MSVEMMHVISKSGSRCGCLENIGIGIASNKAMIIEEKKKKLEYVEAFVTAMTLLTGNKELFLKGTSCLTG